MRGREGHRGNSAPSHSRPRSRRRQFPGHDLTRAPELSCLPAPKPAIPARGCPHARVRRGVRRGLLECDTALGAGPRTGPEGSRAEPAARGKAPVPDGRARERRRGFRRGTADDRRGMGLLLRRVRVPLGILWTRGVCSLSPGGRPGGTQDRADPRTMLQKGTDGLPGWIRTTWMPYTERVPADRRGKNLFGRRARGT